MSRSIPWPTPDTRGRFAKRQIAVWCVVTFDVAGGIGRWYGPMHWAKAFAVASFIEATDETVAVARVQRRGVALYGASSPAPDGWQSYEPMRAARAPRINPGHARRGRPRQKKAA